MPPQWWGNYGFQLQRNDGINLAGFKKVRFDEPFFGANCCGASGHSQKLHCLCMPKRDPIWVCALQCLWWVGKVVFGFVFPHRWWMWHLKILVGNARNWPERIQIFESVKDDPISWINILQIIHFYLALRGPSLFFIVLAISVICWNSAPALNDVQKSPDPNPIVKPSEASEIYLIVFLQWKKFLDALDSKNPHVLGVISTALVVPGRDSFLFSVQK